MHTCRPLRYANSSHQSESQFRELAALCSSTPWSVFPVVFSNSSAQHMTSVTTRDTLGAQCSPRHGRTCRHTSACHRCLVEYWLHRCQPSFQRLREGRHRQRWQPACEHTCRHTHHLTLLSCTRATSLGHKHRLPSPVLEGVEPRPLPAQVLEDHQRRGVLLPRSAQRDPQREAAQRAGPRERYRERGAKKRRPHCAEFVCAEGKESLLGLFS